ncbi:MAG: SxtJ family membrane protein [Cyanobacteria bacterium J06638_22]
MIFEPIAAPNKKMLREFGLVVGGLLALLLGLVFPLLRGHGLATWPFVVGGALGLIGLMAPAGLRPIYYGWMRFGQVFAWINNALVLSLVFYGVVAPMGLIMRSLLGYDPMAVCSSEDASFRKASATRSPKSMEKPF